MFPCKNFCRRLLGSRVPGQVVRRSVLRRIVCAMRSDTTRVRSRFASIVIRGQDFFARSEMEYRFATRVRKLADGATGRIRMINVYSKPAPCDETKSRGRGTQ